MHSSMLRKLTGFPLLPNRIVLWLEQLDLIILYPETSTVIPLWIEELNYHFEIRNYRECIQRQIYFRGFYELRETKLIKQLLRTGDTFIDIGANIGWYTVFVAHAVGTQGRVIAFEPSSQICDHLKHNVNLNSLQNVNVERIALSNQNGEAVFSGFSSKNEGGGAIIPKPEGLKLGASENVQTLRFDDYAHSQQLGKVRLVKIDVEGAELMVLQGMSDALRNKVFDYMLVEVSDKQLKRIGSSSREVFSLLEDHGYSLHIIEYMPFNQFRVTPLKVKDNMFFGNIFVSSN
jgi:FkbM family methyltransferase